MHYAKYFCGQLIIISATWLFWLATNEILRGIGAIAIGSVISTIYWAVVFDVLHHQSIH